MTRLGLPWRIALAAATFASSVLLAGCASRQPAAGRPTPAPAVRDGRLLGTWHVTTLAVVGRPSLHADFSTTAGVRFRRDGLFVVNGELCGAPHFTTAGVHLVLHWPASSECSEAMGGTQVALRIATDVEKMTSRPSLTYAVRPDGTLMLRGGRYRVELRRGKSPQSSPSIGPSSPVPYTGSASSFPP